jgi:hypothetical protein
VVFHTADEEGRAIELFGDAAEMRAQRVAGIELALKEVRGFISIERAARPCG